MSLSDALDLHAAACESMHQIILQENRHLKGTGTTPDAASLQAKRVALGELTASLATIQAGSSGRTTPETRAAAARAQQVILKALLVDRENEKLLLKATEPPRLPKTASRPPAAHFHRAYSTAN